MTASSDPRQWQIGMLGYGEVGRILAEDLRKQDIKVAAYDIKLESEQGAPLRKHAAGIGVELLAVARRSRGARRFHRLRGDGASGGAQWPRPARLQSGRAPGSSISTRRRREQNSAPRLTSMASAAVMSKAR